MKKVTNLLMIVFTVMAFAACSGTQAVSTNPADLQGDWILVEMNDSMVSSGENYTLSFNNDGTVAGKTDCNYLAGEYSAMDQEGTGVLSFDTIASTKSLCESSMSEDYVSAVKASSSYEVHDGSQLMLRSGSGTLVFNKVTPEN